MPLPLYQIDAFTDRPFAGNPAAVCFLAAVASDEWMQHVAAEMNLAETAFLLPEGDGYRLRWFTPMKEVDLCGHATLASAHALWTTGRLAPDATATFETRSGTLRAWRRGEVIVMDFPAEVADETEPPRALVDGIGAPLVYVAKNRMDYLVEVEDAATLHGLRPNMELLARLGTRGVMVTAAAGEGEAVDFLSRYFAPAYGIPEDPVTGSAHCCLGPFWAARLGRGEVVGYQASARGGTVHVTIRDNGRVALAGQAVTVLEGRLLHPPA